MIVIMRVDNGYILESIEGFEVDSDKSVFEDTDTEGGEVDSLAAALQTIAAALAPSSRYDAKRIHVCVVPGDKHPMHGVGRCELCGREQDAPSLFDDCNADMPTTSDA